MKSIRTFLLCAFALFAVQSVALASIIVTAVPYTQPGTMGGTVTYALTISGLGNGSAPSVGNFDIGIQFPGTLSYASTSYIDPAHGNQLDLQGFTAPHTESVSGAVLTISEVSLDDPNYLDAHQLASFQFASVTFNVLASGSQTIGLTNPNFGDSLGNPLSVTIAAGGGGGGEMPEPATWLLAVSAIGILFAAKRFAPRTSAVRVRQ